MKDLKTLRKHAYRYIPSIEDYRDTSPFNNFAIARLLCPRHMRDTFDLDKELEDFCHCVQNGLYTFSHHLWPSFLYPETGYNPDAEEKGLLRGPFLISVSLFYIFTCTCARPLP